MLVREDFKSFNLTASEEEAVIKVIKDISDVWEERFDDVDYLIKWMRARKFVADDVVSMIRNDITWRHNVDSKDILQLKAEEVSVVMSKYWPGGMCGEDKEGRPVYLMPFGQVDLYGLVRSVRKWDLTRYVCWFMEDMHRILGESTRAKGRKINQITMIFDMDGFSMKHITYKPGVDGFIHGLLTMEDHYPETVANFLVINAPTIFNVAYTLISPFITDIMKSKIHVLGANYKLDLLNYIPVQELPEYYGGMRVDENGDGKCTAQICYAGTLPTSLYLAGQTSVPLEELTREVVGRGFTLQLPVVVSQARTVIRWEFMTEDYDIGFGVFMRTKPDEYQHSQDMREVVATERFNTHLVPEYGSYTCQDLGTYVLRFDNTYSWMTTKTVLYKVDVIPPTDCTELVEGLTNLDLHAVRKSDLIQMPKTVI